MGIDVKVPLRSLNAFCIHVALLFSGGKLWKFSNYTLEQGYPIKPYIKFPEKPRAALNIIDRKGHSNVYIFGVNIKIFFKGICNL